jgi:hypothetical protein
MQMSAPLVSRTSNDEDSVGFFKAEYYRPKASLIAMKIIRQMALFRLAFDDPRGRHLSSQNGHRMASKLRP